jgi:hypothetical protein
LIIEVKEKIEEVAWPLGSNGVFSATS